MKPKISIVMPMYNMEKFIEPCINSVLNQTFEDFELIVVDDQSTDRSFEIVREKYSTDSRVKLLQQVKNGGDYNARNLALRATTGDYVYVIDSDDLLLPNTLEVLFVASEESNADVVYMNSYFRTEDAIDLQRYSCLDPEPRFLSTNLLDRLEREYLNVGVYVTPWIKIQRRDFLFKNEIYFPVIPAYTDVLFNLAELCFAKRALVIDFGGYVYRKHPNSTMSAVEEKLFRRAMLSMSGTVDYVSAILSSPRLIEPLSDEMKVKLESRIIFDYFKLYLMQSYESKNLVEIDKFLRGIIDSNPEILRPEVTKNIVHALALNMLQGEKS